jgi:cell cycle sensor histidine kinase DivJ
MALSRPTESQAGPIKRLWTTVMEEYILYSNFNKLTEFIARMKARAAGAFSGLVRGIARLNSGPASGFVIAHILSGVLAALLLAGLSAFLPGASPLAGLAVLWLIAGFGVAALPAITGSLEKSEAASAIVLAGLTSGLAALTGGLQSPFLIWLLAAPAEAALSGRKLAVWACVAVSGLGFSLLLAAQFYGVAPAPVLPASAMPALAVLAWLSALGAIAGALLHAQERRNQTEALLRARENDVRMLTSEAADMIARLGPDGRVLFASSASERVLGYSAAELAGLLPGVLVHIADLQIFETALIAAREGPTPVTASFRVRRKDASYIWIEMSARSEGSGAIVAVLRDMSERKVREQSLIDARDEAEAASKSKSRFLANMSHELRTPLNAIIGFSDMIRQEVFGPVGNGRYREYASHIHSSGQHLVDMISDLLDMSKIEAGKFRLALKPVDIGPLVDETIEMVRLQAEEAGVGLIALVPKSIAAPMADRRAVKQILLNLLSNAIKFTPSQGRVTVSARRDAGDILLEVKDTGVGIPEADLERIGKPFEQAGPEAGQDHMRTQKGTGLGLSLVAALANLHGGAMRIDSAPGDGTTVTVTLPIEKPADTDGAIIYPEKFRAVGKA